MVPIKDDQKLQGTITFKKMWETVSMGKGNRQFTFLSGEKVLQFSPRKFVNIESLFRNQKHILHHHYLFTTAEVAYIHLKETAC